MCNVYPHIHTNLVRSYLWYLGLFFAQIHPTMDALGGSDQKLCSQGAQDIDTGVCKHRLSKQCENSAFLGSIQNKAHLVVGEFFANLLM